MKLTFGKVSDVSLELLVHNFRSDTIVRDRSLDVRESVGLVCDGLEERSATGSRSTENEKHLSRSNRTSERVEDSLVFRVTKGCDSLR